MNEKLKYSVTRNMFILFFCIWLFVLGLIIGYISNNIKQDQMILASCIQDRICYLYNRDKNLLSKDLYIVWLIDLIDENKLTELEAKLNNKH